MERRAKLVRAALQSQKDSQPWFDLFKHDEINSKEQLSPTRLCHMLYAQIYNDVSELQHRRKVNDKVEQNPTLCTGCLFLASYISSKFGAVVTMSLYERMRIKCIGRYLKSFYETFAKIQMHGGNTEVAVLIMKDARNNKVYTTPDELRAAIISLNKEVELSTAADLLHLQHKPLSAKTMEKIKNIFTTTTIVTDINSVPNSKHRRSDETEKVAMKDYTSPTFQNNNNENSTRPTINMTAHAPNTQTVTLSTGAESRWASSSSSEYTQQTQTHYTSNTSNSNVLFDAKDVVVLHGKSYLKCGLLGKGGSGKVFRVFSFTDRKMYALKRVKLCGLDQSSIEGFKQEISLLLQLQNEEHIVKLYDYEQTDEQILMLMESGEFDIKKSMQLEQSEKNELGLKRINNLRLRYIYNMWSNMLEAVHTAHEHRIVHGDLKPANFIVVGAKVKLIDFGIAKLIGNNTLNIYRESQIGTLNFMAPEAVLYNDASSTDTTKVIKLGKPSDVWSLGCILYLMVYNKTPFSHLNMMETFAAIQDHSYEIPFPAVMMMCGKDKSMIGDVFVNLARKCLTREQEKRPTIPELLTELENVFHSSNRVPGFRQRSTSSNYYVSNSNKENVLAQKYVSNNSKIAMKSQSPKKDVSKKYRTFTLDDSSFRF